MNTLHASPLEELLESLILVLLCSIWPNFESDYMSGLVLLNVIVAQDICTCLWPMCFYQQCQ